MGNRRVERHWSVLKMGVAKKNWVDRDGRRGWRMRLGDCGHMGSGTNNCGRAGQYEGVI